MATEASRASSTTKEKNRDLKVRFHDANAREQWMMISSKLARVHLPEFPEMGHLFPDLHVDARSCRAALVRVLFSRQLHYFLFFLLLVDVLLVTVGLQLKIEVASMEGVAVADCLGLTIPADVLPDDPLLGHEKTFLTIEEARHCVEENEWHKSAETLEHIDHAFAITSICILSFFLLENILFLIAFQMSYFQIVYFPLDLFVILVSLGTEIFGVHVHTGKELSDVNTSARLGTASSMARTSGSPVAALLIIGRLWRFARIGHAVYILREAEEKTEDLQELHEERVEESMEDSKATKEDKEQKELADSV